MSFNAFTTDVKELERAIIKVLAFFDMFDYPLTKFEIWRFCGVSCSIAEIEGVLSLSETKEVIKTKYGFYFFSGREKTIEEKMKRYNFTNQKFKRAVLISRIFRIIPWIKMIAFSNIIGANNLKDESDIDLFIITSKKRAWITRFFCAGFLKLFNLRPKENNEKNKICLNFYLTEDALDLEPFMLKDSIDIYFIYWLACLIPVYNRKNTYEKLVKENRWLFKYLPNLKPQASYLSKRILSKGIPLFYREVIDLMIGGLEKNLRDWQLKKMPKKLKDVMNRDSRVVINDQILKLHSKDRREEYRKRWQKKLDNWM